MKEKHNIGIIKPIAIFTWSAIAPINGGQKAPPATAITKNDDPFFVKAPKSRIPNAKIVGNIIDIKKYVENNAITEIVPKPKTTVKTNKELINP